MYWKKRTIAIAAVVLLGAGGCAMTSPPVTGTAFVMDTVLEYKLYGASAQAAGDAIQAGLADLEARLSLYQADSEISRLNDAAGKAPVALSEDTFSLLERCVEFGRQSDGVFDVTIAPLALAWDITAPQPHIPTQQTIDQLLPLVDYKDILLDADKRTAMLAREGQKVDLGGIAKGYACGLAREIATAGGVKKGYISLGGNLMVMGKKSLGEQFKFGVRDPRGSANDFLAVITLPGMTMATSGDYERYFIENDVRYHHILNPADGYPCQSGLMSVSVVSADGAYADYMSTYLFIKGKEFAVENIDAFDCGLVVIDDQRNIYVSKKLQKQFSLSDPTGTYRYEAGS